jgi:2-methylcitrate dehydratase PrpD
LQALWRRVTSEADPELDAIKYSGIGARPAAIDVATRDGRSFSQTMLFPPGHPENPMTAEELADKFYFWSQRVLTPERSEELRMKVDRLEQLADVSVLGDALRV